MPLMKADRGDTDFELLRLEIERAMVDHLPSTCPEAELLLASRHATSGPAKRVRSLLLVLTSDGFGGDRTAALAAASAIEFTHAASLILDDLPSMDNADERRGKPATHIAFGEATAVLSAIALLNQAFAVLSSADAIDANVRAAACRYLAKSVGFNGLVAGQMTDLREQGGLDLAEIEAKHFGKTGALFAASLALGGVVGDQSPGVCEQLWTAGGRLGVAFQGYDDLLDRHATASTVGKPVGADQGKQTIATVMARELALTWCAGCLDEGLDILRGVNLGGSELTRYVAGLGRMLSAPLTARTV